MKIINLHGIVGVHISAKDFNDELDNSTGDLLLDLNSGGGYITEGVSILNKMRSYDRGKITARVSYAASMMTQIALAADEVQVYDNSIFMIHNALGVAMGDYREMEKRKNMLKSMSNMLSQAYVKKTGKTRNQILKMMDDETYLYGNEIVKEGFADTLLEDVGTDENKTKDEAIAYAHIQMEEVGKALKDENLTLEQLTACVGDCTLLQDVAGPTTFKDLPMVDRPWDGDAAVKRVRSFLNAQEKPNNRYKQAFFWYNTEEPENFGAYKLPFVDIVDDQMVANIRGVNAANGAMSGARGQRVQIPDSDRSRVQSHIDRYRDKWEQDNPRSSDGGQAPQSNTASGGNLNREDIMDINQLKAEHPSVYAEAVKIGASQERERVEAHITLGEAAGDTALALENIKSGAELTTSINAKYMAAGMNKQSQNARNEDNVPSVTTPASKTAEGEDEAVARELAKMSGVKYDG